MNSKTCSRSQGFRRPVTRELQHAQPQTAHLPPFRDIAAQCTAKQRSRLFWGGSRIGGARALIRQRPKTLLSATALVASFSIDYAPCPSGEPQPSAGCVSKLQIRRPHHSKSVN